jgi:hypothetical protein
MIVANNTTEYTYKLADIQHQTNIFDCSYSIYLFICSLLWEAFSVTKTT